MYFSTLIHQRILSIQTTSLSSFRTSFPSSWVLQRNSDSNLDQAKVMMHNFKILARRVAVVSSVAIVYSTAISMVPHCTYKVLGRIVMVSCASLHGGVYKLWAARLHLILIDLHGYTTGLFYIYSMLKKTQIVYWLIASWQLIVLE